MLNSPRHQAPRMQNESCPSFNLFNRVQTIFHDMTQNVLPQYKNCHAMDNVFALKQLES